MFQAAIALSILLTQTSGDFRPARGPTLNLIQWTGAELPKIYERSAQPPLRDGELEKLTKAGFGEKDLVKMLEERRCACDASPDALIGLKKAGVAPAVIKAVSLHSLPPNRSLDLLFTLDFTRGGKGARRGHLYIFVEDGDFTRMLSLNLHQLLSQRHRNDSMVDSSDLVLQRKVRRIQLVGDLPLRTPGKKRVMVVSSGNPAIQHPSDLSERDLAAAQEYQIDHPAASPQRLCRLHAGYQRDAVLKDKWHYRGSRFECEWD